MTNSPDQTPEPSPSGDPASPPPGPTPRRLTRSRDDRMIAGVAGGLAEYFDVDPSLVRIALVVLGVMSGGTAVLFYAGAWLVLPEASEPTTPLGAPTTPTAEAHTEARHRRHRRRRRTPGLVWGLLLIGVGALLLAREADIVLPPAEGVLAVALIVVGVLLLVESRHGFNGGLLLLALLLAAGLGVSSRVDLMHTDGFSERTTVVQSIDDLDESYEYVFGQLNLDLRGVTFPEGTTEVSLVSAFGSVNVRLPADIPVRVQGETLFGSTRVRGREMDGFSVDDSRADQSYEGASRRVLLRVTTLFGSTEVQ
ncbi:MAG: PspC domain-containing protein [Dehalococcoidia bacterium]|nr:MAG: PspC domain-containing protein [Dehalococcoidia bacterium]